MAAVSVKSNGHLNSKGFSAPFLEDAWAQWSGESGNPFDRKRDLLVLAVGSLAITVKDEWLEIASQASKTDPARLAARLSTKNPQSNDIQRDIFASVLNRGAGLNPATTEEEAAALLARLRLIEWADSFEGDVVNRCAGLTVENTVPVGVQLWNRLQGIAKDKRTGGSIELAELVDALRSEFHLKNFPDHQAAWELLRRLSEDNRSSVHTVVGPGIRFSLDSPLDELKNELSRTGAAAVIGASGTGKSALVASLLGEPGVYERILWFRKGQLAYSSQFDLARGLQLQQDIPTLIRRSTAERSVLAVDGLEQFDGDALDRVLELIAVVSEPTSFGWHLIITCQPLPWRDYRIQLLKVRDRPIAEPSFRGPEFDQIYAQLRDVPGMGAVLLRKELKATLSNLATLDQVVRAKNAQPLDLNQIWVGETHVIDWIWNYWIGSGAKKYLRGRFLQELGELEGDKVGKVLKIGDLHKDQLEAFGEAEKDGLIRVTDSNVQFAHDIMGDWARYRMLKDQDDLKAVDLMRNNARIPRWGRAIRLYAQSLAEQNSGLERWNEMLAQLNGMDRDSILAADLFADSLTLATNSILLLDQLMPSLIENDGRLLRRILQRLQSTASVAHPFVDQISDPELREVAATYLRLPQPIYWLGVLHVLRMHADDVVHVALSEASASSLLYLRSLPVGFPGRDDAAELAVAIAREVQAKLAEYRDYNGPAYQDSYEALLYAAYELPDEVGQIALELCHRREEPNHAIFRGIEAEERREEAEQKWRAAHPEADKARKIPLPGVMIHYAQPLPPPWPDGPSERVSESFVSAVMDTPALGALIATRPLIAAEVILAVCIEEPREPDRQGSILDLGGEGLSESKNGNPPMYFKGPFLTFLNFSPVLGIETILRLINFATERWFARRGGDPDSRTIPLQLSWEFLIGAQTTRWIGDGNVFNWHRVIAYDGCAAGSALMALEKWFYQLLDQDADIAAHVSELFSKSRSVAFAGVLMAVGMYKSSLLNDLLRPLLTCAELLLDYPQIAESEADPNWQVHLVSWANAGKDTIEKVIEWDRMPHRQRDLYTTMTELLRTNPDTLEYLSARAARWRQRWTKALAQPKDKVTELELILAIVDPANYRTRGEVDGEAFVEFELPDSLLGRHQARQPQAAFERTVMGLPALARQVLQGRAVLKDEDLEMLFAALQEIAGTSMDSAILRKYKDDAIAGGLAVLFVKYPHWLVRDAVKEAWCLSALRNLKIEADKNDSRPAPILSSLHNAEAFRAEAALALLETRRDPWILRAVLDGVTGFFYQSTSVVMYAAYSRREVLEQLFQELLSVVHLWSAVRHAVTIRHNAYAWKEFGKYRDLLFSRLASGRLKDQPVTLERAQSLGGRLTVGALRRTGRYEWDKARREHEKASPSKNRKLELIETNLDISVLYYGYSFLNDIQTASQVESRELRKHFRSVFAMQMGTIPALGSNDVGKDIERGDAHFEGWIMGLAASFMAKAEDEVTARSIYAPVLDLGASAHYWVRDFLQAWFAKGLSISSSPEGFGARWGAMVDYALSSPVWQRDNCRLYFYLDTLANELIGITGDFALRIGGTEFSIPIATIMPTLGRWCDAWLKVPRAMAHFSYFLSTPSGSTVMAWGMVRVADALVGYSDRDWDERNLKDGLTAAVQACAKYEQQQFNANLALKAAFEATLGYLTSRMVPAAIQLRDEIGR